ncbi:MAG: hypothetical protein J7647_27300 [Cyanobacteria bacterium SBLK]|nr:hypothetical protein [Cyanobacteria bacterium SBLK]
MTPDQINLLLDLQLRQTVALEKIAAFLTTQQPESVPDIQEDIANFATYNWEAIGAEVLQRDQYGVAAVAWRGKQFYRRSPQNAFGAAIWFSRCIGKDESGKNKYERLIRFKPMDRQIAPISREAENLTKR